MDKQEIKARLRKLGMSREEFSLKVGVNKRTVDNWLSNYPIPERKQPLIESVLADPPPPPEPVRQRQHIISTLLPDAEYLNFVQAMRYLGIDEETLARRAILDFIEYAKKSTSPPRP